MNVKEININFHKVSEVWDSQLDYYQQRNMTVTESTFLHPLGLIG